MRRCDVCTTNRASGRFTFRSLVSGSGASIVHSLCMCRGCLSMAASQPIGAESLAPGDYEPKRAQGLQKIPPM